MDYHLSIRLIIKRIDLNWSEMSWLKMIWDELIEIDLRWIDWDWFEMSWLRLIWDELTEIDLKWVDWNWPEMSWLRLIWDELTEIDLKWVDLNWILRHLSNAWTITIIRVIEANRILSATIDMMLQCSIGHRASQRIIDNDVTNIINIETARKIEY